MQWRGSWWHGLALAVTVVGPACKAERAPGIDEATGGAAGALPALGGAAGAERGGEAGMAHIGGTAGTPSGGHAGTSVTAGTGGASAGAGGTGVGGDAACGDGVIGLGEDCDGEALGEADCRSLGFDTGTLACDACRFDTRLCAGEEDCFDGRDNDGDGEIDCADAACAVACAQSCDEPPLLSDPAVVVGDTRGHAGELDASCGAGPGATGPEIVYRFVAAETGEVTASLVALTADFTVSLRTSCALATSERDCAYGTVARARITAGDPLYVVVDGYAATDAGPYELTIASHPTACGDGRLDLGEACDDGGVEPGDGCAADCSVESSEEGQNDASEQADPLVVPFFGQIAPVEDEDWIRLEIPVDGALLTAATRGFLAEDCAEGRLDSFLELYASDGTTRLFYNDDDVDLCARLELDGLAAGSYFLRVLAAPTGSTPTFPYVLEVSLD